MPRKLRVQVPARYHAVFRGNNKQPIFDDVVREVFLPRLCLIAHDFEWRVLAWALMTTHYHLILEVGDLGLAAGMQRLNLFLASLSNARFGRINHCGGIRYWSDTIDADGFNACLQYVLRNPVRAGVVERASDSTWTSFRASAGLERAHPALALDELLSHFSPSPAAAFAAIERLVEVDGANAVR